MSGSGGTPDLYEVLGVPENASADEVKRAYYRLVRLYRPSEQPDLFQRFTDAHRTLGDKRRRAAYDQTRRSGRRVQALLDQAAATLEKDPQKAVSLLKNAITLAPDMPRPRVLLAQTLMRMNEYAAAEKQYRWLLEEETRDEPLRLKLARCLLLQKKYDEAEAELQRALHLNSLYFDALMLLARVYDEAGREEEAVATLEQAITNDGAENYGDWEPLQDLLIFYLRRERTTEAGRARMRLLAVLPADDSARRGRAVQRLCQRSREMYFAGEDAVATTLAEIAVGIEDIEESIHEEAVSVSRLTTLTHQARRVMDDPLVEGALQDCIRLKYLDRTTEEARRARLDDVLARLQNEIIEDPRRLGAAIEYLRREYPDISADQNAFLQELVTRIVRRLQILGPEGRYSGTGTDRGPSAMPGAPAAEPAEPAPAKKAGIFGWLRGGR